MDSNIELVRGHADTIIMNILMEQDRYGYEIIDIIADRSHGRYSIKQPTLYNALKRLEKLGFVSSYYGDETNGGRRRYYRLTEKGTKTLTQDQREWEFSRTILDTLLSDKEIDLETIEPPFDPNELRPATKRIKIPGTETENSSATLVAEPAPAPQPIVIQVVTTPAQPVQTAPEPAVVVTPPPAPPAEPAPMPVPERETRPIYNFDNHPLFRAEAPAPKETTEKEPEPVSQEDQLLEKQRNAAARLLFSDDPLPVRPKKEEEPQQEPLPFSPMATRRLFHGEEEAVPEAVAADAAAITPKHPAYRYTSDTEKPVSYKNTLGNLFQRAAETAPIEPALEEEARRIDAIPSPARARRFQDLKQSLAQEGYKLRAYSKPDSVNFYHLNYVYSNKILRDTGLIAFLVLVVELIALFIGKSVFGYSLTSLLIIGGVGLFIALIPTLMWSMNPFKRIKDKFSFGAAFNYSLIPLILALAIITIVHLFSADMQTTFASAKSYVPYILSLNIPICVVIYNILYKSKNYHVKN